MTMEISKTEKALRLIATEGISAKEAAERVGISRAAVSKGKLWPSKSTQNIRKLCEMENEIESLRSELAALKAENESLRKDAARLDWVEHQDFDDLSFTVLVDQPNDGMTAVSIGAGWHLGNNLRAAIDAAMAQGKQGCSCLY